MSNIVNFSKFEIYFLIPLVAMVSLFLIICCFYTYNYADDYLHKYIWEKGDFIDFISFVKLYYYSHGGRALSPVTIFTWIFVGNVNVHLVTVFWLIIHFFNCILMINIISGQKFSNRRLWLIGGLYFAFSWIGMKTHIGYNVFWATGGYMALSGLVFLLMLKFIFLNTGKNELKFRFLALSFVAGTIPENASFSIGVLFFMFLIFQIFKKQNFKVLLFYFTFFLIGFLITIVSPGTFQRMEDEKFSLSPFIAFLNYFDLFGFYLFRNKLLLVFSIFLGFYFHDFIKPFFNGNRYLILILCVLTFFLVVPFSFMPSMSFVKRSGYFFSFISSGLFVIVGSYLGERVSFLPDFVFRISWIFVGIVIFYSSKTQFGLIKDVNRQIENRTQVLLQSRQIGRLNVIVDPIIFPDQLYLVRLLELSDDPDFTDNVRIANYFFLESVSIP